MNDTELDRLLDRWQAPEPSPALRRQLAASFPVAPRRRIFRVPVRWLALCAAGAGALAVGHVVVDGTIGRSNCMMSTPAGPVYVQVTRIVDPPIAQLKWWWKGNASSSGSTPSGAVRGSDSINDQSVGAFYGFRYTAEPLGSGLYKVTVTPLEMATVQAGPFRVTGHIVPLPEIPAPRYVKDGEAFDIDLYRSTSERVFSRLQLSSKPLPGSPRQYSQPSQVGISQLKLESPKLFKDGEPLAEWNGSASGSTVWFRLPDLGRYIIAVDPKANPAFVAAGQVRGTSLTFEADGVQFRIDCTQPVAAGGPHPIYVFRDAGFEAKLKPEYRQVMFGSSGPACVFNGACLPPEARQAK